MFWIPHRDLQVAVRGQLGEPWDLRQDPYGEGLGVALYERSHLCGNLQTHNRHSEIRLWTRSSTKDSLCSWLISEWHHWWARVRQSRVKEASGTTAGTTSVLPQIPLYTSRTLIYETTEARRSYKPSYGAILLVYSLLFLYNPVVVNIFVDSRCSFFRFPPCAFDSLWPLTSLPAYKAADNFN